MTGAYDLPPDMPGFAEAQADMARRSEFASALPGAAFDISYGSHPRQRLDIFPAGEDVPALLFLRGGYWKLGGKEERRFPAAAWQPRGVAWIVPNYRLAPEFTLPEIVDDARAVLEWVVANGGEFGIDATRIHLVGNSAGAQLAAMIAALSTGRNICSLTLISGLYDLVPLLDEEPNTWLRMDLETARSMSPCLHLLPPGLPVSVCCGGAETPAFVRQSRDFADVLRKNGNPVDYFESPGKNHIAVIGECGTPGTPVFEALTRHLSRRPGKTMPRY